MVRYLIVGNGMNLREYPFKKDSFLIGLDRGALKAVQAGLHLNLAYGDFDSVSKEEYKIIASASDKVIRVDAVKNDTDAEGALKFTSEKDEVILLGAIQGKRIEHFLINVNLLKKHPNLQIEDDNSHICVLRPSASYIEIEKGDYKFFSFFSLGKTSVISLHGFAYPLSDYALKGEDTLCISNQISAYSGSILIKDNPVLLVKTKDDKAF